MDKENKLNNAYDPDAAELLKGLDLDEDEDEFDEEPSTSSPQSNHSLLNMLASSTSLNALNPNSGSTQTLLSTGTTTAPHNLSTPASFASPSYASNSDLTTKDNTANNEQHTHNDDEDEDNDDEDTVVVERPHIPVVPEIKPTESKDSKENESMDDNKNAEQEAKTKDNQAQSEENDLNTTKTEDNSAENIAPVPESKPAENIAPIAETKPFSPIKPFEVRTSAPINPTKPTRNSSDASDTHETDEAVPSNISGRRPPVPPPMPAGGLPTQTRIIRDGEIVITNDALNEMLPGGRNDEARDLAALKFNDNNWYAQIFNEDFFRTVPASTPRQTAREAKFIIDRLGIESGARVLDLCCGFGRHAIELSKRRFDMVGLDLSMVMLKKALADAQAQNMAIKFVHGDMRKLTFKAIFDAIYNVQTSFGYFDDLSNFKVLQGIYRALKPGGVFLIETVNRDFIVNDLPLRLWWQGHECKLLEEIDLDYISGVLKVQRSFVFDAGNRAPWEQKIQIRLYSANEMRALLMRAGFKVLELSGDYSLPGAHFGSTSPKNIFVAEKPIK